MRFGIQSRMLLVTFAIGSLFVLFIAISASRQASRDRAHVREEMRLVAGLAEERLDDHIGDVIQLLDTLASTAAIESSAPARNDELLQSLAARLPRHVEDVSLWAADGSNIGSSEPLAAGPRPNAADRAFFTAARRGPGLAIDAPVRFAKGSPWLAVFALPIVRDGQTVAVASVSVGLRTLPELLDPEGSLPTGAVISIIDGNGRVISRSVDAEQWIGQVPPFDRTLLLRRMAEGQGGAENIGLDGVRRIFGYARSRSARWLIYVGIPVDVALASANADSRESLAIGLAMLAAGLLFSAWAAGRIARPLRQLSADARLLGEGRFHHRSEVRTGSEIGLLADTLNRMAEAIEERRGAARRSAERLRLALEGSEQALFDWDIAKDRIYFSARASAMRGGPNKEAEITAGEMQAFVHPDDVEHVLARLKEASHGASAIFDAEYRIRRIDDTWLWVRSRGRIVERDGQGKPLRIVGTAADISQRRALEDDLRQRAEFDSLTGLPNRALFNDRLASAIERASRSGRPLALLFLDIDHFKGVNDSRGHGAGDELLRLSAQRLLASVRSADTVARLAGDEFTVILEGVNGRTDAEGVAMKLVEALRVPMQIGNSLVHVSTSVGVAMLEPGETDPASLLRRADEALYAAKRSGRDRYAVSPVALV